MCLRNRFTTVLALLLFLPFGGAASANSGNPSRGHVTVEFHLENGETFKTELGDFWHRSTVSFTDEPQ